MHLELRKKYDTSMSIFQVSFLILFISKTPAPYSYLSKFSLKGGSVCVSGKRLFLSDPETRLQKKRVHTLCHLHTIAQCMKDLFHAILLLLQV